AQGGANLVECGARGEDVADAQLRSRTTGLAEILFQPVDIQTTPQVGRAVRRHVMQTGRATHGGLGHAAFRRPGCRRAEVEFQGGAAVNADPRAGTHRGADHNAPDRTVCIRDLEAKSVEGDCLSYNPSIDVAV